MANLTEILQHCRLCLVKNNVNVPIFENHNENGEIFLKISSCLPVTVSRDDELPKNICDDCSNKLDLAYEFRNSSVVAEKQLQQWLQDVNVKNDPKKTNQHEIKEEPDDTFVSVPESLGFEPEKVSTSKTRKQNRSEPPPKRARRAAAMKRPVNIPSESDEDADDVEPLFTKEEDESGSELDTESHDPTFEDIPTSSADQPGPSGVGKDRVEKTGRLHCKLCRDRFCCKWDLRAHVYSKHGYHQCEKCSFAFRSLSPLMLHQEEVHKMDRIVCFVCKNSLHFNNITEHLNNHHTLINAKLSEKSTDVRQSKQVRKIRSVLKKPKIDVSHTCDVCGKAFRKLSYFKFHQTTHDPLYQKPNLKCKLCDRRYTSTVSFSRHLRYHKDSNHEHYLCDLCGANFKSLEGFVIHQRIHTGEKPYTCEVCGKSFTCSNSLRVHNRTHTKEKPYECAICHKRYTQKSGLNVHMRFHTGERPYECTICLKKFVTNTLLRYHKC